MTHFIKVSSFNSIYQKPIITQLNIRMRWVLRYTFSSIKEQILKQQDKTFSNLPENILNLTERKLYHIENHPLCIIKEKIKTSLGNKFQIYDKFSPISTVANNFDALNVPLDHISRSKSDTYYINKEQLLRTHTSCHQLDLLKNKINHFAVFGDVYRRDQIDRYHYPVFHQMEAVGMLGTKDKVTVNQTVDDLKQTLQKMATDLFGKCQMRWVDAYFPFTHPSFQLQIFYDNKWVQMLGCGVIHDFVLQKSGRAPERGWAAGLGLERFAMKLFKIPDVRLFWSTDKRFLSQFTPGHITQFKQFSKYPPCYKDISMWINDDYNPNDLFEIMRQIGGDLIENVEEIMTYKDSKSGRTAKAYRILFRSLERTLENNQITEYQMKIRDNIANTLKTVTLR